MRSLALSTVREFEKERTRLGPKSLLFFAWEIGARACENMQKRVSHGETVRVGRSAPAILLEFLPHINCFSMFSLFSVSILRGAVKVTRQAPRMNNRWRQRPDLNRPHVNVGPRCIPPPPPLCGLTLLKMRTCSSFPLRILPITYSAC